MKKGLWTSTNEFREFAAADKATSLSSEIATRERSIDFYNIGMALPNPDPVLKKLGKNIEVYKELRVDPTVRGCITSRRAGVKKLLWDIDRGKSKSRQAKFVSDAITTLPVQQIINQILNAPLFGYQPLEIMWDLGVSYTPRDVIGKPQEWFVYDPENKPRFITKENMILGEVLPEHKFIIATNDPDYKNPYGDPILSSCFWPVAFRKAGYKWWVTFTEKYGMPWPIGKHPRGIDQTEIENLIRALANMITDGVAAIPDDSSVEFGDWNKTASAEIYEKLVAACDKDINVAILGHSGGAQSTPGKLGNEQQAVAVREDIVIDDKRIVEDVFNTLIDYTCELNFSERTDRPRFILFEEEDVDLTLSERDEKLTAALDKSNLKLTRVYFEKGYSLAPEDIEDKPAAPAFPTTSGVEQPAQFSKFVRSKVGGVRGLLRKIFNFAKSEIDNPQSQIDDASQNLSAEDLQKQAEGVLKPVMDLINSGSSYEDIMTNLTEAYPNMDSSALEEMLSRAIFVAECLGRITAKQ